MCVYLYDEHLCMYKYLRLYCASKKGNATKQSLVWLNSHLRMVQRTGGLTRVAKASNHARLFVVFANFSSCLPERTSPATRLVPCSHHPLCLPVWLVKLTQPAGSLDMWSFGITLRSSQCRPPRPVSEPANQRPCGPRRGEGPGVTKEHTVEAAATRLMASALRERAAHTTLCRAHWEKAALRVSPQLVSKAGKGERAKRERGRRGSVQGRRRRDGLH
jgi:hypothetical protein